MEFTITIPVIPFTTILTWYMLGSIATSILMLSVHAKQAIDGTEIDNSSPLLYCVLFLLAMTVAWPLAWIATFGR